MSASHAMALPDNDPDRQAVTICRAHGRTVRRRAARGRAPAAWKAQGQVPAGQPLGSQAPAGAPARSQAPSTQASNQAPAGTVTGAQALPGAQPLPGRAVRPQAPSGRTAGARAPSARAIHGQAIRRQTADVPLRLTRRGRVVVAVASAIVVAVVSLIVAGAVQATSHPLPPRVAQQNISRVVVRPGQSLWSVAESADPHADTRLVVQQIIELNGLTGDTVAVGQQLWVPRG
jgi:LysM repeat protein